MQQRFTSIYITSIPVFLWDKEKTQWARTCLSSEISSVDFFDGTCRGVENWWDKLLKIFRHLSTTFSPNAVPKLDKLVRLMQQNPPSNDLSMFGYPKVWAFSVAILGPRSYSALDWASSRWGQLALSKVVVWTRWQVVQTPRVPWEHQNACHGRGGRLDGGMHMSVTCSPLKTEIREDLNWKNCLPAATHESPKLPHVSSAYIRPCVPSRGAG